MIRAIDTSTSTMQNFVGSLSNLVGNTDAVGTNARFKSPCDFAVSGDVGYVADAGNNLIRAVNMDTREVTVRNER